MNAGQLTSSAAITSMTVKYGTTSTGSLTTFNTIYNIPGSTNCLIAIANPVVSMPGNGYIQATDDASISINGVPSGTVVAWQLTNDTGIVVTGSFVTTGTGTTSASVDVEMVGCGNFTITVGQGLLRNLLAVEIQPPGVHDELESPSTSNRRFSADDWPWRSKIYPADLSVRTSTHLPVRLPAGPCQQDRLPVVQQRVSVVHRRPAAIPV